MRRRPDGLADTDLRLPAVGAGQSVALFGGSFNPPHSGHLHVARAALVRLRVDQVWWMVTPGNPLKAGAGLAPLATRVRMCRDLATDLRMKVTAFEVAAGIRYSADAVRYVLARRPANRFVWLMGADNLAAFHRWQCWRGIVSALPIAIVDRPGASRLALAAPAARAFRSARIGEAEAAALPSLAPPAWVFLHAPLDPTSSTGLRAAAGA